MGQQDPAIWQKVQQELDQHREGGGASFARGNFVGWTAHTNAPLEEEFCNRYTSANLPSVFGDSPLFGAVSDSSFGAANSFGADLPPLDAIPPLPSLEGSAYVDPAFISLDAASSYARSNSTSSSGPSPHLSPFNLFSDFSYASSVSEVFHSPYSSPPIGTTSAFPASFTGSGMFSEGSRSPFEEPAPPLFPGNEDTWKAQLEQIMGIPAAVGQVAYSAPSAPLARSTSTTGRAPRRGSSGREAPRFNPMAAHSTTHSRSISYSANDTLSQSAPISIGGTSAVGLANIALQMSALSTSPRSIPTSPLLSPRDALSRAGSKKRAARPLVWNESVVAAVPKNLNHIFAVHAQVSWICVTRLLSTTN